MPTKTADVPPPPDAKSDPEPRAIFALCLLCALSGLGLLLSAAALLLLGD